MSNEKKSTAYEQATGGVAPESSEEEGDEHRAYVPRAIFTRDAVPDLSKIQVGMLRVAQGMTEEVKAHKANVGQFVLSNFPAHNKVILVPFGAQDIRQYKPDPKKPPMCQAPTGDFGFGNPGGPCDLCPLSHWGEYNAVTEKSVPPVCKEGVAVRFYSVTHRCLVDYTFLAGDRSKGAFIQQQGMSFGWSNFAVEMTTTEKSNNKGSWFVAQIQMLDEVPQDQLEIIGKWFDIFSVSQVNSKEDALRQLGSGTP